MTPETSYMEDSLSIDQNVCVLAGGGRFRDDSSALHLLCTLLHQFYLS